jgi:hypothetical protein
MPQDDLVQPGMERADHLRIQAVAGLNRELRAGLVTQRDGPGAPPQDLHGAQHDQAEHRAHVGGVGGRQGFDAQLLGRLILV